MAEISEPVPENTKSSQEVSSRTPDIIPCDENGTDSIGEETRFAEIITLTDCNKGLGLKICGGCSINGKDLYGVHIKYVIPGGVAANSGQLQNGDEILMVNGESLEGVTIERAKTILRKAASQNHVELLITRDKEALEEYMVILEKEQSLTSSPVNGTMHRFSPNQSPNGQKPSLNSSHYNGVQDFIDLESPWKQFASHPSIITSESTNMRNASLARNKTLAPSDKVHVDRLQGRLSHHGLPSTPEKLQELHQHLDIDDCGLVTFGNFVEAVNIVFKDELDAIRHKKSSTSTLSEAEDSQPVNLEREELKRQVQRLEALMKEKEKQHEIELLNIRKETQAAIEENRSLKTRVHLAEEAQVEAKTLEHDYEEAVAFLESEIRDLRVQLKKENGNVDSNKHLTAVACQLKKSESRLKTYQTATEKLLTHIEHVEEVLTQPPDQIRGNESEEKMRRRKEKKKQSVMDLIKDGQTVVRLVRSLTETAPLPFGWEEAFSEDGSRYYLNHITQTTSWTHPDTGVEHRMDVKPSTSHG